ncbi:MAG: YdeI/OmpD-associated family protein [Alphaproteobacteria bacterium]|nr:YdeI/OmpD-associated family protein [Alphaproteobacteria bacterium]
MSLADAPRIEFRSRAALRDWLEIHHGQRESVWAVTYKKSHPDYLEFGQVVEELMCWGWVDSSVRRVDEDRHMHLISPRKENSAWSGTNKAIVRRMRESGQMTPAGEAKIAAAKANGMWEFLDDVERLERPADLDAALSKKLLDGWEAYPASVRRAALEWIKLAKTQSTRDKRIADIAASLKVGLRPTPFRG